MAQPPLIDDDLPPTATSAAESGEKSQGTLDELLAKATAKYATKNYSAAAEFYSRATELQAQLNGEMSAKNADLLYLYGRCLYHVAVQNSDVLGNKMVGEEQAKSKAKEKHPLKSRTEAGEGSQARAVDTKNEQKQEDGAEDLDSSHFTELSSLSGAATETSRPFFNITGDENWDDSDDELAETGFSEESEDDEAIDDFQNAFEVLDIARVLLEKRLIELSNLRTRQENDGEAKNLGNNWIETKKLKEKLADTRDLQAEISLEAERFGDAATDLQIALDLKNENFPFESSVIAEAHYKLSLALEFSSISPVVDADGQPQPGTVGRIDDGLRKEAARHMEKAIQSCRRRVEMEEGTLRDRRSEAYTTGDGEGLEEKQTKVTEQSVMDVKEMITDMEQRLRELKEPPITVKEATDMTGAAGVGSLLGSLSGNTSEAQRGRLEEVVSKANDLSSLVKRKKSNPPEKRKAEFNENESQNAEKKTKQ